MEIIKLFQKIILNIIAIISFYHFFKLGIIKFASISVRHLKLTKYYNFEMAKGVVELPLIVLSHLFFAFSYMKFLNISLIAEYLYTNAYLQLVLLGFLLGIGMLGFSSLLCRALIEILRNIPGLPHQVNDWLIMVRSGWLRHHLHAIDLLPIFFALLITLGQVSGEEIVFRSVLIHQFLPFGIVTAVVTSTLLFMVMQIFHMPNLLSSIFAVTGALVIGLVNGIVYCHLHSLIPLVVSHLTFFAIAVL